MKNFLYSCAAKLRGKNLLSTPMAVIKDQLLESRPLPMGREAFEEWSDRIISGACIPGDIKTDDEAEIFTESQKFTVAEMIMHLGPTESHKPDAYFIHSLRKAAVNQVAHTRMVEIKLKNDARKAAKIAAEQAIKDAELAAELEKLKEEEGEHEDCKQAEAPAGGPDTNPTSGLCDATLCTGTGEARTQSAP